MIRISILIISIFLNSTCSKNTSGNGGVLTPQLPQDKNWKFETTPMWADEFDNTGLPDPAKWGYDVGGSGWGNNELQYYTDAQINNAKVENGKLSITARKESFGGKNYTSAR